MFNFVIVVYIFLFRRNNNAFRRKDNRNFHQKFVNNGI